MALINSSRIHEIFMDCLFHEEPSDSDSCIAVYGCLGKFGFDPNKIESNQEEIHNILLNLQEEFFENTGGGYSFLNLPFDKNGDQWGEQMSGDKLMLLGLASGWMQYLFGQKMWKALPGRVPYVMIHNNRVPVEIITIEDFTKNHKFSISVMMDM